nr:ABC-F family ATP-binding cassette domain-containing protein [Pseudobdellovibrionaceae bacterium]
MNRLPLARIPLIFRRMVAISNASKRYGTQLLYEGGNFQINPGEKIGLVGPNGAGKSTLFKILTKEENLDSGTVTVPSKLSLSYFAQNIEDMRGKTVLAEVMSANQELHKISQQIKSFEEKLENSATHPLSDDEMAQLLETYGEVQTDFERLGGYTLESRAQEILTGLGIPPEEHLRPTETFSGGWKMRIALAKVLVINPELLLMDEPTNHLDIESIIWLEEWLKQFPGAVLMTSHDREFMNRLVSKIIEVSNKSITTYSGNYDFYEKERHVRRDQLIASHKRQQDMLAKEEEFIARFAARASHAAQVQSRVKKLDKIDRIEIPIEEQSMDFEWPIPIRGGDEVVKFQNLEKKWNTHHGKEHLVFSGASALVKRMDRVAVVGVNGAGKSTLLKIIAGQTDPTSGFFQLGASISMGYFSQNSLDVLTPSNTILEEVHGRIPNSNLGYVRNLLGAFKFSGEDVDKKISI